MHKVFVVIPNWNGLKDLKSCLKSLNDQTTELQIVVVDNGSTDGSAEWLEQNASSVIVVKHNKNKGFAGGVNAGIKLAIKNGAKFVALFNNDAVAKADWLEKLLAAAEDTKAGIVTGKLLKSDKKHIDSTGEFYSTRRAMPYPRGRNELDSGQYEQPQEVFAASGGASLYSIKMLKQIGLFDESFFAYYEDVDISFRAQLAGWKIYYTPQAVAYHQIGGTSSRLGTFTRYHSIKNFSLLYTKDMSGYLWLKYLPNYWLQLIRMFAGCVRDRQIGVFFKAIAVTILLLPITIVKRFRVQSSKKITPKQLGCMLVHGRIKETSKP